MPALALVFDEKGVSVSNREARNELLKETLRLGDAQLVSISRRLQGTQGI
jgi:hypothetical protein